jgi:DNA-binding GntR family transcriptional regulator
MDAQERGMKDVRYPAGAQMRRAAPSVLAAHRDMCFGMAGVGRANVVVLSRTMRPHLAGNGMNSGIDRKLVGESAYEQLRNDIMNGTLVPGQKLKLNALRLAYGVSVNTLRETLMRLVSDGFVEVEGQKGFRVKPVSVEDLEELMELRVTLEILGLRKSFANSANSIDWKARLISTHYRLSCMEKLMIEDESAHASEWERADRDFHMAIVSNCGSKQLIRYHASVLEQFMRYQLLALHKRPFRGQQVADEHRRLLNCLVEDDVEGAVEALSAHINKGSQPGF